MNNACGISVRGENRNVSNWRSSNAEESAAYPSLSPWSHDAASFALRYLRTGHSNAIGCISLLVVH
jgi:hypothetical protein